MNHVEKVHFHPVEFLLVGGAENCNTISRAKIGVTWIIIPSHAAAVTASIIEKLVAQLENLNRLIGTTVATLSKRAEKEAKFF